MGNYDSGPDVRVHKLRVERRIRVFIRRLLVRALKHDDSKLHEPERSMFNAFHPLLTDVKFGTEEYRQALEEMGPGLQHHYQHNRHHPEHYPNGISGMSLVDVVEMVSDWLAAAETRGQPVNLDYLAERFAIEPQLLSIIRNTIEEFSHG